MLSSASSAASRPHGAGREDLLAATVRVAGRKGLRGVTMRAVADEAGVNNTLIVHHFGTRDGLLEAALEWSMERSIDISALGEAAVDAVDFRRELVAMLAEERESQVFQFEMVLEASRRPELQPAIRRLYDGYVAALASATVGWDGGRSGPVNRAMFAALDGLVLQFLGGAIAIEELVECVEQLGEAVGPSSRS